LGGKHSSITETAQLVRTPSNYLFYQRVFHEVRKYSQLIELSGGGGGPSRKVKGG